MQTAHAWGVAGDDMHMGLDCMRQEQCTPPCAAQRYSAAVRKPSTELLPESAERADSTARRLPPPGSEREVTPPPAAQRPSDRPPGMRACFSAEARASRLLQPEEAWRKGWFSLSSFPWEPGLAEQEAAEAAALSGCAAGARGDTCACASKDGSGCSMRRPSG
jgi:hypothetical protein